MEKLTETALRSELKKLGLQLIWFPKPEKQRAGNLAVFGADVVDEHKENLEDENALMEFINRKLEEFIATLGLFGIERSCLHSSFSYVARGKMWQTLVARIEWDKLQLLLSRG
jgi:hypothetical protein